MAVLQGAPHSRRLTEHLDDLPILGLHYLHSRLPVLIGQAGAVMDADLPSIGDELAQAVADLSIVSRLVNI